MTLSDGIGSITALVNSSAYEGIKGLNYKVNSIISVSQFKLNLVKGKKVIIIEAPFKVLAQHDQIGCPKPIEKVDMSEFNKSVNLTFRDIPKENMSSQSNSQFNNEESKAKAITKPAQAAKSSGGFVQIMDNIEGEKGYTPIAALSTMNNDWIIKARVTKKGQPRHWKNFRGEGDLLNIELKDEFGDMIQGTFFNKQVDQFKDQVQENKVYSFEKGYIKEANSRYTSIKNNL